MRLRRSNSSRSPTASRCSTASSWKAPSTKADIVLGLDTNLTAEAKATGLFAPHGIDPSEVKVPGGWTDDTFVPFDYGYFAVVYDTEKLKNPPKSLKELVEGDPDEKIVIQDPRTSTPGLGLLLWVKSVYGDKAPEAWAKLKAAVLTVTPGWSEAYGLFTKGEAPMVLSYTTSPAYHMVAENTERYQAASFAEGHYLQIEVAGITTTGAKNPLAAKFLAFMTGPELPGCHSRDQLDVPGRQDRQAAQPGLRQAGQAGQDACCSARKRWRPTARPGSMSGWRCHEQSELTHRPHVRSSGASARGASDAASASPPASSRLRRSRC